MNIRKIHMVSATNKFKVLCGMNISSSLKVVENSDDDALIDEVTCIRCSKIIGNDLTDTRIPPTVSKFCRSMQGDVIKEIL